MAVRQADDFDEKETGRIEAFSDGVFAIVTTLLILDVKVPLDAESGRALGDALLAQWPTYFAYITGFSTAVIMWINHHTLFKLIKRSSHTLLLLNSLLLLAISGLPFPTALAADYIASEHQDAAQLAAMVYSGFGIVIAVLYNLLWRHMSHNNRLIDRRTSPDAVAAVTRAYRFGPLLYLAAFVLALASPLASLGANLALAIFFALPNEAMRKPRKAASEA